MVGEFIFDSLLGPILVAVLICVALSEILKVTKKMADEFGEGGAKLAGAALGVVAGVATGGAAVLGRGVVGGIAARQLASGNLAEGSWQHKLATGATKASFDVRNLAGDKSILGKTVGGMLSKGGGKLGVDIGKGGGVGGVEKAEKDRIQAELKAVEAGKVNIFEEEGIRDREATQRASAETAEGRRAAAQEAHENSTSGQLVKEKRTTVDRERATSEEATKKAEEAQKAHDTMRNSSSMRDPKIIQALEAAKKAEKEAIERLNKAEVDLATVQSVHDSLSTADDLNTATAAAEAAAAGVRSADTIIEKENTQRRDNAANRATAAGRHTTAAKIRGREKPGEKSYQDLLKEAAEKQAKEERDRAGAGNI